MGRLSRQFCFVRGGVLIVTAGLVFLTAVVALAAAALATRSVAAMPQPALSTSTGTSPAVISAGASKIRHFEYVLPDDGVRVYDIDRGHRLVQRITLPRVHTVRGVVASPATHMLYVSYGGDGGGNGNGSMLAYDLLRDRVVWHRDYENGVDSMAISPNGKTIYMPEGELSTKPLWHVIEAATGEVTASITAGAGPHNTVVGLDGRYVYLGGRNHNALAVASTASERVVREIGPLESGVRPFTINGEQTLAFTTATGFLGFQVSSITSGRVLYTLTFPGFSYDPARFSPSAPSHGISLAPNEREVYVLDAPNSYVHVFDVTGLPTSRPRKLVDVKLVHPLTGDESPCSVDCERDGWLQHSRDGRYVYVGDSGDVIDTRTRKIATFLPALRNTRKSIEIDWRRGRPVATTSRYGLGYVRARR